jgi:hypothetical protein
MRVSACFEARGNFAATIWLDKLSTLTFGSQDIDILNKKTALPAFVL